MNWKVGIDSCPLWATWKKLACVCFRSLILPSLSLFIANFLVLGNILFDFTPVVSWFLFWYSWILFSLPKPLSSCKSCYVYRVLNKIHVALCYWHGIFCSLPYCRTTFLEPYSKTLFVKLILLLDHLKIWDTGIIWIPVRSLLQGTQVHRFLTGLTAYQIGTTARWYSNKTPLA